MSSGASPAPTPVSPPDSAGDNNAYPPQRHAGKVGYGPEYGKGASSGDKFQGLKEEIKGKVLHKPELVQHGHELRTGELKRKELEDDTNPFQQEEQEQEQATTTAPEGTEKAERQQSHVS